MEKNWILTIGIDKFYLTDKQKDFYIQSVNAGVKYVLIDEYKLLGTSFQSLVNEKAIEETEMLKAGKAKCEYEKWHKGSCLCGRQFEIVNGKAIEKINADLQIAKQNR